MTKWQMKIKGVNDQEIRTRLERKKNGIKAQLKYDENEQKKRILNRENEGWCDILAESFGRERETGEIGDREKLGSYEHRKFGRWE